jgi:hypothetical protein
MICNLTTNFECGVSDTYGGKTSRPITSLQCRDRGSGIECLLLSSARCLQLHFFLPKPNGSIFNEILSEVVCRKETLSSADTDEGQLSAIFTSRMISATFFYH